MNAIAILRECSKRGIYLRTERGVIVARPKGKTPENLRARVVEHKAELIVLLGSDWNETGALELLKSTLDAIEARVGYQLEGVSDRTGALLAEFGPVIERLFLAQDLPSLRYCLVDLERNVHDAVTGRGYDNELAPAPCPVCKGECRWCITIGIIKCCACFPDAGARRDAVSE